jgi:hypothetical protein
VFNDPYSVFRTHQLEIHHKLESTNKHEKHSKATKAKEENLKQPRFHIYTMYISMHIHI